MRLSILPSFVSILTLSAPSVAAETTDEGAALAASAAAAAAEAAEVAGEDGEVVVVEGVRGPYGVAQTATATKTSTPIKDIPQALTVITQAQVRDQQLRSVGDLLHFVPGATPGTGESNRDQFTLRGNNTTADLFIDGVRDDAQYFRDFYNIERIEVLRGPNAMIFGRGGGGGLINRVTKRAGDDVRDFALSSTSEGGARFTADIGQAVGSGLALRLNAMAEDGESFRRHFDLTRYGINPALAAELGSATKLGLAYEYFHDRRTADRGVPAEYDRPLEGHDRTFFGDPDDSFAKADVHIGNLSFEHDFGGGLTLRNRTLAARYDKFYQNIYPTNYDEGTGEVVLGAYNSRNDRTNLFSQTDLVREGRLAGIDQTLLVGFELGRQWSRNRRLTGSFVGGNRVPLGNATTDSQVSYAPAASDANNRTRATVAAVYAQDQLRPADWLEIVAGVRLDSFKLSVDDLRGSGTTFARRDTLVSPRLGLVLKPMTNLSLYGSYSRSYLPQSGDQFGGLDATTSNLKPERFDNIEAGVKWEPVPGLLATAAIYQLDRINSRATDPADPKRIVLTGKQRSRGIELGLERSLSDRWLVSAGYALQDAEIRESTTAAPAGRKVPLVPRHSASLWTRYDFTPAFGAGMGLIARSKSYASISNAVVLPGYTRLDGALFYEISRGLEAQVNVENILGVDYFPTAHNDNNIAPGAPRTVKASIGYRF